MKKCSFICLNLNNSSTNINTSRSENLRRGLYIEKVRVCPKICNVHKFFWILVVFRTYAFWSILSVLEYGLNFTFFNFFCTFSETMIFTFSHLEHLWGICLVGYIYNWIYLQLCISIIWYIQVDISTIVYIYNCVSTIGYIYGVTESPSHVKWWTRTWYVTN